MGVHHGNNFLCHHLVFSRYNNVTCQFSASKSQRSGCALRCHLKGLFSQLKYIIQTLIVRITGDFFFFVKQ